RPARGSTVPQYRKCTRESFRPASRFLPLHAKSRCPLHTRPSQGDFFPRPPAPLSFETTPAPAGRTSAGRAAPFCLRRPGRSRKVIHHLAFAFVAPLCAHHDHRFHASLLLTPSGSGPMGRGRTLPSPSLPERNIYWREFAGNNNLESYAGHALNASRRISGLEWVRMPSRHQPIDQANHTCKAAVNLSSSRGALKAGNSFRISSRNRRVYTTLAVETEAVGKAAAQQVEKRFLLSCGLSHPAQSDLTAVCRGQNDVAAVQFG